MLTFVDVSPRVLQMRRLIWLLVTDSKQISYSEYPDTIDRRRSAGAQAANDPLSPEANDSQDAA